MFENHSCNAIGPFVKPETAELHNVINADSAPDFLLRTSVKNHKQSSQYSKGSTSSHARDAWSMREFGTNNVLPFLFFFILSAIYRLQWNAFYSTPGLFKISSVTVHRGNQNKANILLLGCGRD